MRILTITSNDLGINYGPSVHFLELWNAVTSASDFEVTGLWPSWSKKGEIISPRFRSKPFVVPNIRSFRQIKYDLAVANFLFKNGKAYDLIYVRMSHWHFCQLFWLNRYTERNLIVEFNGLAKDDSLSSGGSMWRRNVISFQERRIFLRSNHSIAVTEKIASSLKKRYEASKNVSVIRNGVAKSFFLREVKADQHSDRIKVAYVGTFTSWDGAMQIKDLAASFPQVDFLMIGDGGLKKQVEENAPENVVFFGRVDYESIPSILEDADGSIVLYEFERHREVGLSSMKILEYVAMGLPVFSTNLPGQEWLTENGIGVLIDRGCNIVKRFDYFLKNLIPLKKKVDLYRKHNCSNMGWCRVAEETMKIFDKFRC